MMHYKIYLVKHHYLNFHLSSCLNMFTIKCIYETVICFILSAIERLKKNISFIFHYSKKKPLSLFKQKIY